jgi:Na+/H+-dicarboxylate symporter
MNPTYYNGEIMVERGKLHSALVLVVIAIVCGITFGLFFGAIGASMQKADAFEAQLKALKVTIVHKGIVSVAVSVQVNATEFIQTLQTYNINTIYRASGTFWAIRYENDDTIGYYTSF